MRNCFIILVVLSSLMIQACATTNVVTTTIPGKELSRTSLGVREIDNRVMMEEIDPLSVKLYRRVSTVEYTKSVFQAVNETRHENTTYDCRNAYDVYPAFLLTTLGVPLLYEMATGFDFLRKMCDKNPPTYSIKTADTDKTLIIESFDNDKVVTNATPIAGGSVTVEIAGNKYVTSTTTSGIATFPENEIPNLQKSEHGTVIDYQYNEVRLSTQFRKRAPQEESKVAENPPKSKSSRKSTADDPSDSEDTDLSGKAPSLSTSELSRSFPESIEVIGLERSNEINFVEKSEVIAPAVLIAAAVSIAPVITPDTPNPVKLKLILNVNFDMNKTAIRNEYIPRLEEIGQTLKENPGLMGIIEGHSDNVGSKELNRKVSIRRAEAVAQYLIKTFGISSDRLKVEGYGMSRPIADNATPKGRALNRRIEAEFWDMSLSSATAAP